MAEVNILDTLNGLAKEVYGEDLINSLPENVGYLMKNIPFKAADQLGNAFHMPVIVADEQGVTYAAADEDDVDLEESVAMTSKDASVKGTQIISRATIGYKAAASIAAKGKAAFTNATELVIKRLMESSSKRIEMQLLYGGSGLGQADGSNTIDANSTEVEFLPETWAPGIWIGQKGGVIEFYDGATLKATVSVKRVSDVRGAKLVVESDDSAEITALNTALSSDTLDVFWRGAKDKEALGLDKIITTAGQLFGIDNEEFDLFKGQTYDCGNAALTFDKVTDAVVDAINFGLDEDLTLLCSPRTWQDLNKEQAALRQYDYSYKANEGKNGFGSLRYIIQNVEVEVRSHPMVKEGEAFLFPKGVLRRVGAYDLSMKNPGMGSKMFRERDNKTSFELRAYTDQALFCERPARLIKLTGITNSNA